MFTDLSDANKIIFGLVVGVMLATVVYMATRMWQEQQDYKRRQKRRLESEKEYQKLLERTKALEKQDAATKKIEDIIDEKRNRFVNIPSIAFHFANAEQIKSYYNDYFTEPTVASLVSEITGEIASEIKGSIPQVLESKIGTKDIGKWVSTIKLPDTSLNGMFLRYQRETIKSEQVTLGIEEVEIELSELQVFDRIIDTLQKRFEFELQDSLLNSKRVQLKEKAAEKTLTKLEQATGWVLVEGRFRIETEGNFYRCTYSHPVNEYLSDQAAPVSIAVLISTSSIEPSVAGNYAASIGKLIPLRVYGQVWQPIDRKTGVWQLQLTPLAIY